MLVLSWLSQIWTVTLRIQEYVFSGCIALPDSKETKLGSSNQEASLLACKNTGIVLVPYYTWKCVPKAILSGVDISEVPRFHLLWQMSSQWESQPIFLFFILFLTQWIMVVLSEGCKPDNFELLKSLKLSFTKIWGLHLNFIERESFLKSTSPNILALC